MHAWSLPYTGGSTSPSRAGRCRPSGRSWRSPSGGRGGMSRNGRWIAPGDAAGTGPAPWRPALAPVSTDPDALKAAGGAARPSTTLMGILALARRRLETCCPPKPQPPASAGPGIALAGNLMAAIDTWPILIRDLRCFPPLAFPAAGQGVVGGCHPPGPAGGPSSPCVRAVTIVAARWSAEQRFGQQRADVDALHAPAPNPFGLTVPAT